MLGAAAAQGLTLVIYLGAARLADLQTGLRAALPEATPAAVAQHAGLPHERRLRTTLGSLAADALARGMASPAIVLVGDVLLACAAAHQSVAAPEPAVHRTLQRAAWAA